MMMTNEEIKTDVRKFLLDGGKVSYTKTSDPRVTMVRRDHPGGSHAGSHHTEITEQELLDIFSEMGAFVHQGKYSLLPSRVTA